MSRSIRQSAIISMALLAFLALSVAVIYAYAGSQDTPPTPTQQPLSAAEVAANGFQYGICAQFNLSADCPASDDNTDVATTPANVIRACEIFTNAYNYRVQHHTGWNADQVIALTRAAQRVTPDDGYAALMILQAQDYLSDPYLPEGQRSEVLERAYQACLSELPASY